MERNISETEFHQRILITRPSNEWWNQFRSLISSDRHTSLNLVQKYVYVNDACIYIF